MALQWRKPQSALKPPKTLGEMLIILTLSYASPLFNDAQEVSLRVSRIRVLVRDTCFRSFLGNGTGTQTNSIANLLELFGDQAGVLSTKPMFTG